MTRRQLIGFLQALHWRLEKPFLYKPEALLEMPLDEMRAEAARLEEWLREVPDYFGGGEPAVSAARLNATKAWETIAWAFEGGDQ